MHYFFVTAQFKFRKNYVNSQYNSDPTDVCAFTQKEVYMIEQKSDEADDIFFTKLKKYLLEALQVYADSWVGTANEKVNPHEGWKWRVDTFELDNVSKLN